MNWCRPATRLAVYLRDGLACAWCATGAEAGVVLTLDHVRPDTRGGGNDPGNLVTACKRCNSRRRNLPAATFARAVAAEAGATPEAILARVRAVSRRALPRAEARALLARRGTVRRAIEAREGGTT